MRKAKIIKNTRQLKIKNCLLENKEINRIAIGFNRRTHKVKRARRVNDMNLHIIIDFMHIYYKYFFQLQAGHLQKLSAEITSGEIKAEKDTTLIYYPLKDIESIRKSLESNGNKVTLSICFDSRTKRKDDSSKNEVSAEYKSNRTSRLKNDDYENLTEIRDLLKRAGHNVYKEDGYEADDLVNYLANAYKDRYDYTVIYTNDKDILVNIGDKIGVMRFKAGKGYNRVSKDNYEEYLEQEFKVFIPYNILSLYLSTVGDTADNIKGIHKFGKVAFKKLITKVGLKYHIDWKTCDISDVIEKCKEFLTDEQYEQLKSSYNLVKNIELDIELDEPINASTIESREKAYNIYGMKSLI